MFCSDAKIKSFCSGNSVEEFFINIQCPPGDNFNDELENVAEKYASILEKYSLNRDTLVFSKVFFSDIVNQKGVYAGSKLLRLLSSGFIVTIQQRPLPENRIALFAYHVKNRQLRRLEKKISYDPDNRDSRICSIQGEFHQMVWHSVISANRQDSSGQTFSLFSLIDAMMSHYGLNLKDNAVRTWIYVQDIDNRYEGMVRGGNRYFDKIGLCEKTRYIASTGIEGKVGRSGAFVNIDTLAFSNLQKGRIVRMQALESMPPTMKYGVAFERGLRIRFGDRSHLYISGTASIDRHGNVLHLGNPLLQTGRAIENIRALLAGQGACLSDLMYLFVYVRDPNDMPWVKQEITKKFGDNIPVFFLEGAVCRPGWLVEIEGVAIVPDSTDFPDFF